MPNKDTYHDHGYASSLVPAVYAATTKGNAVSVLGFQSALVVVNTGAIVSSGDYTMRVEESDTTTDGDFAAVDASDMLGELPASLAASTDYRVGYIGKRKYVRAVITKNSGTSIAASAAVVQGGPAIAPLA